MSLKELVQKSRLESSSGDAHTWRVVPNAEGLSESDERRIRIHLLFSHGHSMQYLDDGELQCSQCAPFGVWDYKREPLTRILDTIDAVCLARAADACRKHDRPVDAVRDVSAVQSEGGMSEQGETSTEKMDKGRQCECPAGVCDGKNQPFVCWQEFERKIERRAARGARKVDLASAKAQGKADAYRAVAAEARIRAARAAQLWKHTDPESLRIGTIIVLADWCEEQARKAEA